jgi:hypothetical protein
MSLPKSARANWSARSTARSQRRGAATLRDLLDEVSSYPNVAGPRRLVATAQRHAVDQSAAAAAHRRGQRCLHAVVILDVLFHPAEEATAAIVGGRTA